MSFFRSVAVVWLRSFAVFKKNIAYAIVTTFVEPFLYLASFGFGLGPVIGKIQYDGQSVDYRAFVLSGIAGQTILFIAFFDSAYGGFIRMYYQKIYHAIAVTQVTLSELLWGELLWCSSRALLSTSIVLLIGSVIGDFDPLGSLVILPVAFLAALLFSALGMLVAAMSKTIESLSYPQYLLIFPMFLFCGVYFPLGNLPEIARYGAELLPLSSILAIARGALLGFNVPWWSYLVLGVWLAVLVPWARHAMRKRLLA